MTTLITAAKETRFIVCSVLKRGCHCLLVRHHLSAIVRIQTEICKLSVEVYLCFIVLQVTIPLMDIALRCLLLSSKTHEECFVLVSPHSDRIISK